MEKDIRNKTLKVFEEDLDILITRRAKLIANDNNNYEVIIKINKVIRDVVENIHRIESMIPMSEYKEKKESITIHDLNINTKDKNSLDVFNELSNKVTSALNLGIFLNSYNYRDIGKSIALVDKARLLGFSILCKTKSKKDLYSTPTLDFDKVVLSSEARGLKNREYLVDEEFSETEIIKLKKDGINIVSGFICKEL